MFTNLDIARRHALGLSRTLMTTTLVIKIGTGFVVITADDFDASLTIINEYDPFD